MTPIPLAPKAVKGLVNLRGQIITAIDLGSLLGLESTQGEPPSMNVVIRSEGERVSLLVDSIGDVLEMEEGDYEEIPETVPSHIAAIVQGVFKLSDELLLVLDGKSVTTPAN
jgi:purine-binding chemotaxis protein CheW